MLMQQSHRESFWIGLDDLGEEHVHRWADGSKMNYQNGEFNRYPNGQPDKVYFSEDCVEEVKKFFPENQIKSFRAILIFRKIRLI